MTATRIVLTGIAQILHDNEVGTWSPEAAYTDGATGIVLGGLPQTPSLAIGLTDYAVSSDPKLSDTILGVQVRLRGDTSPGTVMDMRDAVFDALHGLQHVEMVAVDGRLPITQIVWKSAASLGPDGNNRHERSENYWVYFNRPHPRLE